MGGGGVGGGVNYALITTQQYIYTTDGNETARYMVCTLIPKSI